MSDENATKKETTVAKFELKIEGKLESLPKISAFIDETMRQCNIESLRDVYAVQLSVDEACTNIIKHAYSSKNKGEIAICCVFSENQKFIVNITDWGVPFDPTVLPEPDTESDLKQRKVGGLGVFFMRKFMNEITYVRSDDANLLTLAKYIEK
ncbi:MAG: ATP-binding protein [Candidatus Bathyarchaeia archaeon]